MANLYKVIKHTAIAESARLCYFLTTPFFKKDIWIISESPYQAQENGYELFCWIEKNTAENVFYVIDKKSPAINKFKQRNNWLAVNSFKLSFYLYHANRIISTHGLWMIADELGILKKLTRKTLKAKRVMLNHGIGFLKNGREYYHKSTFPLNNLIVSLSPKHKNIFTSEYGYSDKEVVITGFPRFDSLVDSSSNSKWNNMILFMPTFRDKEQKLGDGFKKTQLYKSIKTLLEDKTLIKTLKNSNSHIAIYLHQNIQPYSKYLDCFSGKNIHIIRQKEFTVSELLKMSKLLITDYSSVLFDFVYMNKPFISYQFDYNEFIASRKDKAFIDMRTELPGYVVNNHQDLIHLIEYIIKNNFSISKEHIKCAKEYFTYQDEGNCQRVYSAIKNISE